MSFYQCARPQAWLLCWLLGLAGPVLALDVNQATRSQLRAIKGVGDKLADRILSARAQGRFVSMEDFAARVPGVGMKKLKKLREQGVTVGGSFADSAAMPQVLDRPIERRSPDALTGPSERRSSDALTRPNKRHLSKTLTAPNPQRSSDAVPRLIEQHSSYAAPRSSKRHRPDSPKREREHQASDADRLMPAGRASAVTYGSVGSAKPSAGAQASRPLPAMPMLIRPRPRAAQPSAVSPAESAGAARQGKTH